MARAQVLAALQQHGVEAEAYGADNLTATQDEWEIEFYFATDGTERLRQLSVEGEAVFWNGQQMIGTRVDDTLRLVEAAGSAMWEANDVTGDPFPEPDAAPAKPVSDEELLEEGTIWLPERGLGLVICEGEVIAVAWRAPQDMPARFAGPVTEAQRQLSLRSDLESHLRTERMERHKVEEKKDPLSPLRTIVSLATIVALGLVAKKGFEEMRLWSQAPTLTAKFVAIEQAPLKQFRDFLPPALRWVIPRGKPVIADAYRVEFTAPREESPQQAVLERGELYVPPQQPGDEVPVAYLDGNPPRVKGLARARDSAFVDYVPWAIAIGAIWLVVQFALNLLPGLLRLVPGLIQRLVPSSVEKDPDRPELR